VLSREITPAVGAMVKAGNMGRMLGSLLVASLLMLSFRLGQLYQNGDTRRAPAQVLHNLLLKMECENVYAPLRGAPPSLVVDVGGHVGHTAAEMASHGHTVHVFEPFRGNLVQLRENVARYGSSVHIYEGVVSADTGFRRFDPKSVISEETQVVKGASSYTANEGTSAVGTAGAICTEGTPNCIRSFNLDKIFPTEELLMLKIDVQGGEFNVLTGAAKLIADGRIKYLFFEVASKSVMQDTLGMLDDAGYMCYDHAGLWAFDKEVFRPNGYAADAVPGDKLVLSNGHKWREYWAKERPSSVSGYTSMWASGMQQTDFMCMHERSVLDE
jgi:FkbM family methyltransferase